MAGTLALLNAFGAAFVQIDEPKFRLLDPPELPAQRGQASITCACTDAMPREWWHHAKSEDRYNYMYSAEELQEFSSDIAGAAKDLVKKSFISTRTITSPHNRWSTP